MRKNHKDNQLIHWRHYFSLGGYSVISAILQSSYWAPVGWLIVLAIFFYIVYAAAKSDQPAKTFLAYTLGFSGIEGAVLLGLWGAIAKADQWTAELDQEDAAREGKDD